MLQGTGDMDAVEVADRKAVAYGSFRAGDSEYVVSAALLTLGSWWMVPRWWGPYVYELVPAFFLAAAAALVVSRFVPADD